MNHQEFGLVGFISRNKMELRLERKWKKDTYTIGNLYINGVWFCNTVEDKDRQLYQSMPEDYIRQQKVYGETAIPYGRYEVTMKVQSPKYKDKKQYAKCKGYIPRLLDVPCFSGILIHIGNTAADSLGCILVGLNKVKGKVVESTATFWKLYDILKEADDRGERIYLNITD